MVNFRYHLVSLTAVFLALAAGITIGAGVVGRPTVDRIESQLRQVEARRNATNATNDRLQADLGRWDAFGEATTDEVIEGRLAGVRLMIVGVSGAERRVLDEFRSTLARAGATVDATAWVTARWNLVQPDDVQDLTSLAPVVLPARPEEVRAAAVARLAQAWNGGDTPAFTASLRTEGFLEFDEPAPEPGVVPAAGSIFVVFSGDGADVPSEHVAHPLVERLSALGLRVLAVQPVRNPQEPDASQQPPEFVLALRADGGLAARVPDLLCHRVHGVAGQVIEDEAGSRRGQGERLGAPEPVAGAGHDGHRAVEPKRIVHGGASLGQ